MKKFNSIKPKVPKVPKLPEILITRTKVGIPKIPKFDFIPAYLKPLLKLADFSNGIPKNLTKKQKDSVSMGSIVSKFVTATGKEAHLRSPSRRSAGNWCGPGTKVDARSFIDNKGIRRWKPNSTPIAPWDKLAFYHDISYLGGDEAQRKKGDKALSNGAKRLLRIGKFEYAEDVIITWLIAQFF
jgi:hypothetical protein